MRRSLLAASLCAVALLPMSGCASAPAAESTPTGRADPSDSASEPVFGNEDEGYRPSSEPSGATPGPATPDSTAPQDPWTDRPAGTAGPTPRPDGLVRLRLPGAPLEPLPIERRPSLPARARLALVCARDAQLVHDADALLSLGSELGAEPRLDPVVALGALPAEPSEVDLDGLAGAAAAQGFDLLLIDVRAAAGGADRVGLLLHPETGQVLGWFEVTDGRLPRTSTGGSIGDGLVERVGEAYARAR